MNEHYVATTVYYASADQVKEIERRIKAIDDSAEFSRHKQPGNRIHGWISRPNDGTNGNPDRRRQHEAMRAVLAEVLGG